MPKDCSGTVPEACFCSVCDDRDATAVIRGWPVCGDGYCKYVCWVRDDSALAPAMPKQRRYLRRRVEKNKAMPKQVAKILKQVAKKSASLIAAERFLNERRKSVGPVKIAADEQD